MNCVLLLKIIYHHTGGRVVLVLQDVAEAVRQLQVVIKVDLLPQNDTEEREVGVPQCLLLADLPVQVLVW